MFAKLLNDFNEWLARMARRHALELNCIKCRELKDLSRKMRFHICEKHNCEDYQGAWKN